jgi:hypothetical protein
MGIPKMEAPIPFKMAVVSQLCFPPSRPCHHHSSRSNSRTLAQLSVDIGPSRHLSPSKPRPSSLWQSRSRPKSPPLLCTLDTFAPILSSSRPPPHPLGLLILSISSSPIVLSSCSKAQSPPSGWQSLTLGNLTMRWLLLQGTSINATKSLQDRNIRPINTKPSTRSYMQNALYLRRMQMLPKATFITLQRSGDGIVVH